MESYLAEKYCAAIPASQNGFYGARTSTAFPVALEKSERQTALTTSQVARRWPVKSSKHRALDTISAAASSPSAACASGLSAFVKRRTVASSLLIGFTTG